MPHLWCGIFIDSFPVTKPPYKQPDLKSILSEKQEPPDFAALSTERAGDITITGAEIRLASLTLGT